MAVATLRMPVTLPESRKVSVKSLLARAYAALIEARMRAAMRELAMHRHLVPQDVLKQAGYAASINDDSAYPFTK
ncbi:MAG: hypothetical protein JO000_00920 [Alphaproteobacteria bacterium]|nr:hypothetical protein [Alphaproteobacteria bacterium]